MKKIFLASLLLAAAGCSDESVGPPANTFAAEEKAMPAPAVDCSAAVSGYAYLPSGVSFPFKHHLRADRYVSNRQGGSHRRVIIEFLEGDAATITGVATKSMEAAGFRHVDSKEAPGGATRMRFHRKGAGMAVLTVYPEAGEHAVAPNAEGVLIVEFAS